MATGTTAIKPQKEFLPTKKDYSQFQKDIKLMLKSYEGQFIIREVFRNDLTNLINCHSLENASNTPDWILAEFLDDCFVTVMDNCEFNRKSSLPKYLIKCLKAFNKASRAREKWYGTSLHI